MNSKKLVLLLCLIFPYFSHAQHNHSQHNPVNCSVSKEAGALIKARLMQNRQLFDTKEVEDLVNKRTITYLPLSIHNVSGDASGTGKTPEATILAFLCGLNAFYADQNIQFYIHNSIINRVNTYIYNNAGSNTSANYMVSYKVAGTINLYLSASINNAGSSWYSPQGDYIMLQKNMLTAAAKTESHEIGHFFTLNHTFYGWEGIDAEADYSGQNVPNNIGSGWSAFTPEKVPRSGSQSNCNQAADGFCDTEADYYSARTNCPYNPTMKDPNGYSLDPDESNIMSYASDNCVTQFSTEQKTAIAVDIAARNWVNSSPNGTADVTGLTTPVSPLAGALLGPITNSTVRIEWDPVPNATMYYLEVFGTYFFGAVNTSTVIFKGVVYGGNAFYNLPTTDLVSGAKYGWRIKAFNATSTCAGYSPYYLFEASGAVTTSVEDLPIEKQMQFEVKENPVSSSFIPFSVYAATDVIGSIRLYSMEGKEVVSFTKQEFKQGQSIIQLPTDNLTNGVYVAVLSTSRGTLQQKVVISR